jgi:O-antigen ligase
MFLAVRKVFLYSFAVVVFYGLIETLIVYFNVLQLKPFILLFDYFPFVDVSLDLKGVRISSVTYEPPFLAIYLITIAGWMFSYIITSKGLKKYIPTLLVFMITFFSGSRTALIVVLVQFILFIAVIFTVSIRLRKIINKLIILSTCLLLILFISNGKKISNAIEIKIESLNFKENLTTNISNKSRLGIQYTSLLIFSENPVFGVGFGQQAYHARKRYPKWATANNYEFKLYYLNDKVRSFPPGYNMYTRLLAETGIIGFGIFTTLLLLILYQTITSIKRRFHNEKTISIVLFVSFVGFMINWLQFDSFRMHGFWICLSILIAQLNEKRIHE